MLKLWIDQVARVNKTFSYATGKPEGLLKGKKATVLITSGGTYDEGTAMASWNFVEPYLRLCSPSLASPTLRSSAPAALRF